MDDCGALTNEVGYMSRNPMISFSFLNFQNFELFLAALYSLQPNILAFSQELASCVQVPERLALQGEL